MIGFAATLIVWLIVAIVLNIILTGILIGFIRSMKFQKKLLIDHIKRVEIETKMKYNKLASLDLAELNDYIATIFAEQIYVSTISLVSENDPKAKEYLYETSLNQTLSYFSEDTVKAIEFYYGEKYITRWCEIHYKMLCLKPEATGNIIGKSSISDVSYIR